MSSPLYTLKNSGLPADLLNKIEALLHKSLNRQSDDSTTQANLADQAESYTEAEKQYASTDVQNPEETQTIKLSIPDLKLKKNMQSLHQTLQTIQLNDTHNTVLKAGLDDLLQTIHLPTLPPSFSLPEIFVHTQSTLQVNMRITLQKTTYPTEDYTDDSPLLWCEHTILDQNHSLPSTTLPFSPLTRPSALSPEAAQALLDSCMSLVRPDFFLPDCPASPEYWERTHPPIHSEAPQTHHTPEESPPLETPITPLPPSSVLHTDDRYPLPETHPPKAETKHTQTIKDSAFNPVSERHPFLKRPDTSHTQTDTSRTQYKPEEDPPLETPITPLPPSSVLHTDDRHPLPETHPPKAETEHTQTIKDSAFNPVSERHPFPKRPDTSHTQTDTSRTQYKPEENPPSKTPIIKNIFSSDFHTKTTYPFFIPKFMPEKPQTAYGTEFDFTLDMPSFLMSSDDPHIYLTDPQTVHGLEENPLFPKTPITEKPPSSAFHTDDRHPLPETHPPKAETEHTYSAEAEHTHSAEAEHTYSAEAEHTYSAETEHTHSAETEHTHSAEAEHTQTTHTVEREDPRADHTAEKSDFQENRIETAEFTPPKPSYCQHYLMKSLADDLVEQLTNPEHPRYTDILAQAQTAVPEEFFSLKLPYDILLALIESEKPGQYTEQINTIERHLNPSFIAPVDTEEEETPHLSAMRIITDDFEHDHASHQPETAEERREIYLQDMRASMPQGAESEGLFLLPDDPLIL